MPAVLTTAASPTLAAGGATPELLTFIAIVSVVLAIIAISALMHGRTLRRRWLVALWTAAIPLTFGAILSGFSIGFLFLPAAAFSMVAALSAAARADIPSST